MRISFLGAAGTVTGSRHLVEIGTKRILVDCGLFQGVKALRLRNRERLPFDPAELDAVVLTHAHLDHSGYLPVLVERGYRGPIHCTGPTADLTEILLADAGRLQEEDARYAKRKGYSRHADPRPLYTEEGARAVTPRLEPHAIDSDVDLGGVTLRYASSGHILGAASARLSAADGSVLLSGDGGRPHDLLIPAPAAPLAADVVVMESTYGDREHPLIDPVEALALVLRRTVRRGGVLMIPAFAVGRAQLVLFALFRAFRQGAAPRVPVFLNSPMAIDVTELYHRYPEYHRLDGDGAAEAFSVARYTRTVEESKALNVRRGPMVLLAGAGMLTGGRILHHLRAFARDRRNTVLLTGYQAEGTRGADLLAGKPSVRIHGSSVRVRAEVATLDGMSAHADQSELLDWIGAAPTPPGRVFLVHGEPGASDTFRKVLEARQGLRVEVARDGRTVTLD
ncbi:MAG TPA: MBL fold metallo-hydrolase [Longimicrobiales bacterium]|nr:MBL fold metallo-hydrolase [Longimicrobiales bacterium]